MLISDYLSSNVITCIYFFDLTHFREGRNTKTFFLFLVQMETLNLLPKFTDL